MKLRTKMAWFKFLITFLGFYVCCADGQFCNPPNGGSGTCKSIYECKPLFDLVNKPQRTQEEINLLTASKCGFDGNIPKVCCQNPCYTPEGQPGKCVSIYSCPHLAKLLKPPVPQESINYVQNSKCNGRDQYSVCCGPPRENVVVPGNCAASINAYPPDPKTECCGVDSRVGNKIVGGTATSVDQYPWLAIIEYVKSNQIKLLCGGALISGKYVLTAGHCLTGPILAIGTPKNVRLSEYDTSHDGPDCQIVEANGEDCTDGTVIIPIEQTIPHPEYNKAGKQGRNDIGLIRLAQMAPWNDFIRPICLPTVDLTLNPPPPENFTLFAAGWGAVSERQPSSNVKLHVDLPYVSREQCQPAYRAPGRNVNLWEGQICAGGQAGKDSCKGDSGGPLMFENGRSYEVIGVVSFGPKPCGLEGIPGVYTKVFEYISWIRSNIRS